MLKKRSFAIGAATLLLPAVIGFAAPAQAAGGFVMPSIDGMNLQEAEDAVTAAANGIPLQIHSHNVKGMKQKQLSLADWLVCDQSPAAGEKITSAADVDFGVVREFDAARNTWDDMVANACS
ncbi:PASTA domain-containing protein [Mycobacterium frederiksbergense]|uniref:PASTA domain-containing protein n=1 Tax=Mycolicibacterium frederiksbergense TaxID=117567 RepID=UPI0021F38798|nr:PASTA domain-containing protein [Mycolicibacterium frederiksbergense]MCV7043817.1 PASTA domain-containing protein [Mycolicibacterium frederiksbergense]